MWVSGEPHGGGHGGFHLLWSLLGFGQNEARFVTKLQLPPANSQVRSCVPIKVRDNPVLGIVLVYRYKSHVLVVTMYCK